MVQKILLVEDDAILGSVLKSYLELSDYEVTLAENGKDGLVAFQSGTYDICLLDVMMPKMDGFTLGKKIRKISPATPFIYITARGVKSDVKLGYEIGADDYIVKPFDSELLIFKIKAILNRCEKEEDEPKLKIIEFGGYVFDTEQRTLTKDGKEEKLTSKEALLLEMLYYSSKEGGILFREKALMEIWGTNDYTTSRSMDVFILKLRRYFKDDKNIIIDNIHGAGFKLNIEG